MIVWVHRSLASEGRSRKLAAAVGDHFIYVHVELSAASRHPHMKRKHVFVPAGKDLVANLHDQGVRLFGELLRGAIDGGSGLLQCGVGRNHLTRDQVLTDAEVLKGALRLSAPEFVSWNLNLAEAVRFLTDSLGLGFI